MDSESTNKSNIITKVYFYFLAKNSLIEISRFYYIVYNNQNTHILHIYLQ